MHKIIIIGMKRFPNTSQLLIAYLMFLKSLNVRDMKSMIKSIRKMDFKNHKLIKIW
jgi:hypothetical protein